jgi:HlyD family secretion protein
MDSQKSKIENVLPELRSEEVQEVLGQVPPWILRSGITVLFCIVLTLIIGSWFYRYPDIIQAPLVVTSYNPPANVNARVTGKITQLLVTDKQEIQSGNYLAVIENPADIDDVYKLKQQLPVWMEQVSDGFYQFDPQMCRQKYELGDIQQYYLSFIRTVGNYLLFTELDYYPKRIAAIEVQISKQQDYILKLQNQYEVVQQQYALAHRQYVRDSTLNVKKMLSDSEHDNAAISFLQSKHNLESSRISLDNANIQVVQLQQSILDLQLQELEKKNQLQSEIKTGFDNLLNSFNTWEMTYILKSPVDGKVDISKYWSVNQNITAGETIFTVIPNASDELIGKAQLPIAGSGKVKTGQKVNIRFLNYPDHEYGMVHGVVNNISVIPSGESYTVEIGLPQGLKTTYGEELFFSQEMHASAEIVTDDLRLLERLFLPLKKIFKGQKRENQ